MDVWLSLPRFGYAKPSVQSSLATTLERSLENASMPLHDRMADITNAMNAQGTQGGIRKRNVIIDHPRYTSMLVITPVVNDPIMAAMAPTLPSGGISIQAKDMATTAPAIGGA